VRLPAADTIGFARQNTVRGQGGPAAVRLGSPGFCDFITGSPCIAQDAAGFPSQSQMRPRGVIFIRQISSPDFMLFSSSTSTVHPKDFSNRTLLYPAVHWHHVFDFNLSTSASIGQGQNKNCRNSSPSSQNRPAAIAFSEPANSSKLDAAVFSSFKSYSFSAIP